MKFREFIDEKYIANGRTKEWELMARGCMPLSPSILKEFEIKIQKAYHVTSINRIKDIMKLQGKKVDIATFTIGSSGISMGAIEDGEVIFEMSGYSSFSADQDFNSLVDRNGHRWLDPLKDNDMIVNNKFTVPMNKLIVEKFELNDRHSISNYIKNLDGKSKKEFIAFYYEESKKLITSSLLKEIKESISKNYVMSGFDNNEILLHNFKIKELKVIGIEDDDYNVQKVMELGMIDVAGVISPMEIAKIGK